MKNKEGLWKLSPSSLRKFDECGACFWVDNNFKKQPGLPWTLNSAMDSICKFRYDKYRKKNTFPPEVKELEKEGIVPFEDIDQLEIWRESMNSLRVIDEKVGYALRGKIDDVLVESDGRLIPADYKSSGNAPAEDKQKFYVDQLQAYGFMFSKHGYEVSDRAYLLHYFVKDKTDTSLKVTFDSHVDLVKIDIKKFEKKLKKMVKLLNGKYPGDNADCKHCGYFEGRRKSK